jgi:hypothetical protein
MKNRVNRLVINEGNRKAKLLKIIELDKINYKNNIFATLI